MTYRTPTSSVPGSGTRDGCKELPKPLQELVERSSANLNEEERKQVVSILTRYKHVFSVNEWDLGMSDEVQRHINTGSATLIRQCPRRTAPWKQEEIDRQVTQLLSEGLQRKMEVRDCVWTAN